MEVGELVETVQVTAAIPLIETETSSRGQVIDNRKVVELPLVTRDYTELALLSVGVAPPTRRLRIAALGVMNINGNRALQNNFMIDGIDANTATTNIQERTVSYVNPSPDAVHEFKVQTGNYSAEYGKSSGGIINVSVKSGTNEFHGSVFEFHRDNAISARNFFAGPGPKPLFIQNQFGFALGGPIRRDKTFFFADYQGTRLRKGTTLISTVPSAKMRSGDFTELGPGRDGAFGTADDPVIDPLTGRGFPGGVIPPDRIDPIGLMYANLYPLPNIPGREITFNNFRTAPVQTDKVDQFDIRIDHNFSENKNFSLRVISEDAKVQFRAEFFNIWNTPQFEPPLTVLGAAGFGSISLARDGRQIQFALKFIF